MSNPNGQNPYPGYGQQPPQGYGGYGQAPQAPFPAPTPGAPGMPAPPSMPSAGGRRGGSRALPIIVSAGLAIGVFGGLMIVRGTGKSDAASKDGTGATSGIAKPDPKTEPDAAPVAQAPPIDAAPPAPKVKKVTLKFDVTPQSATVLINGEELSGATYEIEVKEGEKPVLAIEAKASGHKTHTLKHKVVADESIEIRLKEKRSGGSGGSSRGGGGGRGGRGGSGGLIDLP